MDEYDDYFIREKFGDKPIGFPPSGIVRKNLERLYTSILGALDIGDFETFLKEVADLTYDEAKEKLITQYGTPKDLSAARLKAKSAEAEAKIEQAERQTLAEQRTLEDEFNEIEQVAHQYLAENMDLIRRNQELEAELKRLREELAGKPAPTIPPAPPAVPPPVPAAPAAPGEHGSQYQEYKKRITEFLTQKEIDDIANEIFDILEHEEFNRLTRKDADELLAELRALAERKSMAELEKRISPPPAKRRERREREEAVPERAPARRRREEREERAPEAPQPFIGISPAQVVYRYTEPDTETFTSMGEEFIRDFELERVIKYNRLLGFPEHWFTLSPFGKRERYGWDMAMAIRELVDHMHKVSWASLEKDFGIPRDYIEAWKMMP